MHTLQQTIKPAPYQEQKHQNNTNNAIIVLLVLTLNKLFKFLQSLQNQFETTCTSCINLLFKTAIPGKTDGPKKIVQIQSQTFPKIIRKESFYT